MTLVRNGSPGWLAAVAAEYAASGVLDDALVTAATAAGVGLVHIETDGSVWWSDETYRLHERPRWRRVRSVEDALTGFSPDTADRVLQAYRESVTNPDVEVRYAVIGEDGQSRELVMRGLDAGVALVHQARATSSARIGPPPVVIDVRVLDGDRAPTSVTASRPQINPEPGALDLAAALLSASPDLLLTYDIATGDIVTMSRSDPDGGELVHHLRGAGSLEGIVHLDEVDALVEWRDDLGSLMAGEVRLIEARFLLRGMWKWRELRAMEFRRTLSGELLEVMLVIRDVDDRVEGALRAAEQDRAFREVFDASPVGLAVLDEQGRFTTVNDAFCTLAGRTRDAVLATVYEALLHPEDRAAAVVARARRSTDGGASATSSERRLLRSDGVVVWVRVRTSDIDYNEETRTLVSLEDVTASKETEDQLRYDSLHDELTGLPNRRLIIDRLEQALTRSRRTRGRVAVYFIDLDDLKRINDTHPWQHRAGDILITSAAVSIREALRDTDTLGRLGGDEFLAICEDVGDDATVADVGRRILAAVRRPLQIGSELVSVTASVGVAAPEGDAETAAELIRRADSAMYRAKSGGGARLVRADTDLAPDPTGLDLVGALKRDELRLHYRPVVSLASGAVLGVTTVVRLVIPERGFAPEHEVITAMHAGPAALPIVHWALQRAVSDVRTVAPSRAEALSVWVSMPGRAAMSPSTRTALLTALAGPAGLLTAASAPSLVLDVHEVDIASMARRESVQRHLAGLTALGPLALGIQHFTADTVPVGMLQLVGAASMSLDPDLLAATADNHSVEDLVRALVAGASALGVITIATNISSYEQLEMARAVGVHAVQGDLIGPAAPLDSYSDLLHGGQMFLPAAPASASASAVTDAAAAAAAITTASPDAPEATTDHAGSTSEWVGDMAETLARQLGVALPPSPIQAHDGAHASAWIDVPEETRAET
ncbi:MAG: diguanylate cyclase [Actinobacteria bacterium]|uniref:Unannotated protein n=2 Tax=freshwater metagenome TaxID=449393 RepID=A0A6J7RID0_9ZZZZ|nr:diguanylate cyclase [Actinomycetota bacterium]